jgi:hypothetical protein
MRRALPAGLALRALLGTLGALAAAGACKPKASTVQCEQLLDRYAMLVVRERLPDASTEQIATERQREKTEARNDESFRNCSSQVSLAEFDCAMRASTADSFEKCLE